MLPGTLATCEGSYRLRTANNNAGILSWSHVSDERCRMLHDNAGHSLVTLASSPISIDGSCTAYGFPHDEGWLLHSTKDGVVAPTGDGAKVACISAGRTTRLVFDLVTSREDTDSPRAYYDSSDAEAFVPLSHNVRLVSPQDGSIISASHSNIHVRITRDTELRKRDNLEIDVSGAPLLHENACGSTLCVMLTVDGVEWMTTSLERMCTQGGLQSLRGLEGTNVFEVCLFGHGPGEADESRPAVRQGCIARATLLLEMFSAERQMVQRRSSSETTLKPSFMSSGIGVDEPSGEDTRVVFVVDLGVVDGFKLSTLHLVKHLPDTFRVSTLDLSCASESLYRVLPGVESIPCLKKLYFGVVSQVGECIDMERDIWKRVSLKRSLFKMCLCRVPVVTPTTCTLKLYSTRVYSLWIDCCPNHMLEYY